MRQLSRRGFTLIELMVALTIFGLLAVAGVPAFFTYLANAKVRESANQVVAAAQLARSEALKRNATVRLESKNGQLLIELVNGQAITLWRTLPVVPGAQVATFLADYDSTGKLKPFGAEKLVAVSSSSAACSTELRCPVVKLEAGGAVQLCPEGSCP